MLKVLFYAPVHAYNALLALSPRSVFIAGYKPSSAAVRESELTVRNCERLLKYYLTKG